MNKDLYQVRVELSDGRDRVHDTFTVTLNPAEREALEDKFLAARLRAGELLDASVLSVGRGLDLPSTRERITQFIADHPKRAVGSTWRG